MARNKASEPVISGQQIIQLGEENSDGARLIAPSIPCEGNHIYSLGIEKGKKDGFQMAVDGAYPLEMPVLDLAMRVVYSVDMVRLDFMHESQQKVIDAIDKNTVFATIETFTSNRIGSYRFMWSFPYADGKHGGYCIVRDGEEITDGTKEIVLKCGFGVVKSGGAINLKGFVEFNPNKCSANARKFIECLENVGCVFLLSRYDLAIDYSVPRTHVRVQRDRRTYEYILSSKGGATEYLGSRNSAGRVKVYDKAGEQNLDCDLTRIELTCSADWDVKQIVEHLPICADYSMYKGDGVLLALCTIVGDMLTQIGDDGKPTMAALQMIPERYWALLAKNTRYKVKKVLKNSEKKISYNADCIKLCRELAYSFVPGYVRGNYVC